MQGQQREDWTRGPASRTSLIALSSHLAMNSSRRTDRQSPDKEADGRGAEAGRSEAAEEQHRNEGKRAGDRRQNFFFLCPGFVLGF